MAVGRVPGDERPALTVGISDVDAQVPEAHMLEVAGRGKSRSALYQGMDVKVACRRIPGYGCVEEPGSGGVNPSEEPPASLKLWVQHAVRGPRGKAFQARVQVSRPENRQDHALVEVRSTARDACLLSHHRTGAVAADDEGALDLAARAARILQCRHAHAVVLRADASGRPAEQRGDSID